MRIGIIGSRGRLGSALAAACQDAGVPVVAELDRTGLVESAVPSVVFDASSAAMLRCTLQLVDRWQAALIYCVSVLPAEHRRLLERLAERLPVVLATNLSPGHWLQTRLTRQLAVLAKQCDLAATAAVYERHPRTKRDRPSASAVELAAAWQDHAPTAVSEVVGLRYGPAVSDHRVQLDLAGESLSIAHEVTNLCAAAQGGLLLAGRAHELPAGLVTSGEVFDEVFGGWAR
ncbi:dihydrodipicolinate reductase C-terminal domain-containing protein [Jatrophihabitans sp.]|uniref:dihydrodipicolinate reductase C-terminal domain-containing protein n=1 Tax=Jatrophihabitans sp. TaxID=1932789 RepID=UPI002BEEACD1|nr:dihydrodipicolinate reductase C-terminal domain-containing protein [Jatrophihabitans sp.]